jgi:hypothetical protein
LFTTAPSRRRVTISPSKAPAFRGQVRTRPTYRWVKAKRQGCAALCPKLSAFFKPEIVPENLQDSVDEIADNIVFALEKCNKNQQSLSTGILASGSPVHKASKDKSGMELSEIDSPSLGASGREALRSDSSVAQLS